MNIRSITIFLPLDHPEEEIPSSPKLPYPLKLPLAEAAQLRRVAVEKFQEAGYIVQSSRVATHPFYRLFRPFNRERCLIWAQDFEQACSQAGFDYLSLGPALPQQPETVNSAVEILHHTSKVFVSALLTKGNSVALEMVRQAARAIQAISLIEPNGFANLRFAALANVPPGAPFFPAAYHQGDQLTFSLAMEAADLFIEEISLATDLNDASQRLISRLEKEARRLEQTAQAVLNHYQKSSHPFTPSFAGIDFTPAPFPEINRSFGTAIEKLGLDAVGLPGSLAAAAFLTSVLDQARYQRVGFNGLMLPVLEDATLAQRAAEGKLRVPDLLLYSAVCGTGLDTIPLAGDVSEDALMALLLDLAALSLRLNKPLTARLMPIPGKRVGDETSFNFGYFANSRIMGIEGGNLSGILTDSETMPIKWRRKPPL
ncbi:MAG: DUF711 family protein [Anaerolineales bacterium]